MLMSLTSGRSARWVAPCCVTQTIPAGTASAARSAIESAVQGGGCARGTVRRRSRITVGRSPSASIEEDPPGDRELPARVAFPGLKEKRIEAGGRLSAREEQDLTGVDRGGLVEDGG